MRISHLKRLVFIAIALAIVIYLARVFRQTSVEWWLDPSNKLNDGLRDLPIGNQGHSKLPLEPSDDAKHERENSKEDSAKKYNDEKIRLTIEYEKIVLSREGKTMEEKMTEISNLRQERLATECVRNQLNGSIIDNTDIKKLDIKPEILVSDDHKAIFCSTGSDLSEAWREILGGDALRSLYSYREESISYRLRYYRKILVTEQPLVRFLSAFKTALLPHADQHLLDSNGKDIYPKLQELSVKIGRQYNLGSQNKDNITDSHAKLSNFAEFVVASVKTAVPLHALWERIHVLCQPCSLGYNYISRAQTAQDDAKYILSKLDKPPVVQFNLTDDTESTNAESLEEIRRELEQKLLNDIYAVYRIDHDLFGYVKPWN